MVKEYVDVLAKPAFDRDRTVILAARMDFLLWKTTRNESVPSLEENRCSMQIATGYSEGRWS